MISRKQDILQSQGQSSGKFNTPIFSDVSPNDPSPKALPNQRVSTVTTTESSSRIARFASLPPILSQYFPRALVCQPKIRRFQFFYSGFSFVWSLKVVILYLPLTFGGMKRWGLRATFLSSYTELNAWQNVCITT